MIRFSHTDDWDDAAGDVCGLKLKNILINNLMTLLVMFLDCCEMVHLFNNQPTNNILYILWLSHIKDKVFSEFFLLYIAALLR
jgi:hypothetical protein